MNEDYKSLEKILVPDLKIIGNNNMALTPDSLLFKHRTLYLTGAILPETSHHVNAALLALDQNIKEDCEDNESNRIILYLESPGGAVNNGLAIYDTMKHINSPVYTVAIGMAASMGAILMMGGDKRFALPNSTIMFHEIRNNSSRDQTITFTDMEMMRGYMNRLNDIAVDIVVDEIRKDEDGMIPYFGGPTDILKLDEIEPTKMDKKEFRNWFKKWIARDRYLLAQDAKNLGFIDDIIHIRDKYVKLPESENYC